MGDIRLRARYVFSGVDEPRPGGAVVLRGDRIVAVEPHVSGRAAQDLGNVAILPGLVNAHAHLELSDCDRPIGRPGIAFAKWIDELIRWRLAEPHSAEAAIAAGLAECVRQGVVAVADIVQPGWPAAPFRAAPIDSAAFLELIGPMPESVVPELEFATGHLAQGTGVRLLGLSPHAPHTVHDDLLDAIVKLSAQSGVRLGMHLAESREEMELLRSGTGPLRDLLADRGRWDPSRFAVPKRPLHYLRRLAKAASVLVIHGNYLDDEEIAFLGRHRARMAAVYCPRSHVHFGHAPYPLAKMLQAGVRVALGTDSRASTPDLSVLAEMRCAARQHPDVPPAAILGMATLDAAHALGLDQDLGSLEPGKRADLTLVELPEGPEADPYRLLLDSDTRVVGRWYHGQPDPQLSRNP